MAGFDKIKIYCERAISNVYKHGDTDVFPFPLENRILHDDRPSTIAILKNLHENFSQWISDYPPYQDVAITSVGYEGFRWAAQIDPIWNLYLLAIILSISDQIENSRIHNDQGIIFSYRCQWNDEDASIFQREIGWRRFMETSIEAASKASHVVSCDISEFYPRINHHRL